MLSNRNILEKYPCKIVGFNNNNNNYKSAYINHRLYHELNLHRYIHFLLNDK